MTTPNNCQALGLSQDEYQKITALIGREPSLTELAMFSVEWSEHCGYIHSKRMLQLLPKTGKYPTLIGEDSGGIIVDDLAIVFKMESHNHPSQVEPKQGAATGVGGIIRDIFTAGARPIALLDSLRFGSLSEPYNKYLMRGVVDGIQFYGNCLGVPTVGGEIYFDQSYNGNCLVNVMCIGTAKKNKLSRARTKGSGNSIIYAGSSTGRDGIGGCSILASKEFKRGEEKRPTVQIGDPFTEKCLIEATLEALATGYVTGIKDMGAAGLTCASSEMASSGHTGIEIELKGVPLREKNMAPWEIMMSESQERMLLCVKKGKEKIIEKIFSKWGLNAALIGKVTGGRLVRIKHKGKVVAEVKADDLTSAPLYEVPCVKPDYLETVNRLDLHRLAEPKDYNQVLLKLLGSPSIASKEWAYRQYDHMVQTNTLVLPGSDAAVLRLKGTRKAIAATTDCNSSYCYLNPYRGAQIAVAEAARNLVCAGAEPAAVTDCLNFGNPTKPDRFWQFKHCVEGITSACQFFNLPVVSGNVSFYNESPQGAIFPTPAIGMIGIIQDAKKICTQYFKKENEAVVLLGVSKEELGGSGYLKEIHKTVRGDAPELDLYLEEAVQKTAREAISKGLVSSAHDCAEGGLLVALAESCISDRDNLLGAVIDNLTFEIRPDALFFGESQSRIILSCKNSSVPKIRKIADKYKAPLRVIGKTGGKKLVVLNGKRKPIALPLEDLSKAWHKSLEKQVSL
ncbi:MAG: phosphoribosylformylglycinamidine synthase subunit PurL [Candidatus Omnitrophota bacterium]|jgi:phosphoribosylformylglycinamidine synthase